MRNESRRTLHGVWVLRDVDDVEALVLGVIRETVQSVGHERLLDADRDELHAALLEQVVVLDAAFDETRPGIVFRPWLYQRLRWAAIDFVRSWIGRRGEKRVVDVRLAWQAGGDAGLEDAADADGPALSRLVAAAGGDETDRFDARAWLLRDGDCPPPWVLRRRGRDEGAPAASGDRRAAGGASGSAGGAARSPRGSPPWIDCAGCGWRSYPHAPNGVDAWTFDVRCVNCGGLLEPGTPTATADTLGESSSVRAVSNAALGARPTAGICASASTSSSDPTGTITSCV